jgi:hypothetical protein
MKYLWFFFTLISTVCKKSKFFLSTCINPHKWLT